MPEIYTFHQFQADYPDDAACLAKIMALRYGDAPICHECKRRTKYHRIAKRRAYACQFCGAHVYPCVGTPFEKSRTPLHKWFYAMYLFTTTRHGVPAKELERQLGVTYKCAWRMAHEIRTLMAGLDTAVLFGEVESAGGSASSGTARLSRASKAPLLPGGMAGSGSGRSGRGFVALTTVASSRCRPSRRCPADRSSSPAGRHQVRRALASAHSCSAMHCAR